ncbi:ecdysteroid 22-kinase family protein [Frankia sp. AiPa1]|uniref:ecdysteroid 22-kinase family protein n=1 Tax=Frankia sp. AiPa1 TaxID=573492 RepID=UPI00202AE52B|nr:ecdysteroid 22-kinase family protein [Frankia sp. AiPa1]MCL9759751.1 ecdysteroid 22-kinase family protein [Frankia sp. AiPa1]
MPDLGEPIVPTTPTDREIGLPADLDRALSPGWLSRALGTRFPGIGITAVTPGPVVSRVSTNARFRIESAGGIPVGLSPNLCVKGYFGEVARQASPAGVPEAGFYRDLADHTGIRTLRCVYADVDPATGQNIIITEDVVPQGAVFLDGTSDYTPDQAAASLDELALLHARTWAAPSLAEVDWLRSRLEVYLAVRGVREIAGNFDSWIGAGVPAEVRDAERLVARYRELAAWTAQAEPWNVIHGDPHVGNLYLDGAGRPSFLDWQLAQRGPWYIDVGYHLASVLTVADRRNRERDLLTHYLERLRAYGAPAPSWDEAWPCLRRGILHGFYLWGITIKVDPAITSALLERLGTAAADHDALTALAD